MLLKISPDTIVETDQIELIADRGDGKLSLHLRGGERVADAARRPRGVALRVRAGVLGH